MARYDNILEFEPDLEGEDLHIGIVMSRFNIDVADGLLSACTAELVKRGVQESNMLLVTVPGARGGAAGIAKNGFIRSV